MAEIGALDVAQIVAAATTVKAAVGDTTPGTLTGKLAAGTNITLTTLNPTGDAQIQISASGSGGGHVIQEDGTPLTARANLNFKSGLVAADDSGNSATTVDLQTLDPSPAGSYTLSGITVDSKGRVTAASNGSVSAGHTVQAAGTPLTQRANLNFAAALAATDDSGNAATVVDLAAVGTAGAYAYPSSVTTDAKGRVSAITAGLAPNTILINCDTTMAAGAVVRRTATGVAAAQADSSANAAKVIGVLTADTNSGNSGPVVCSGLAVVKFAADPTLGALCYLSTGTATYAQTAVPTVSGTNQKLRLGYIVAVQGGSTGLATVALNIELLSITADGVL